MTSPFAGGDGANVRAGVAVGRAVGTGVGAGVDGARVWGAGVTRGSGVGGSSVTALRDGVTASVGEAVSAGDEVAARPSVAVSDAGVALVRAATTAAAARGVAAVTQLENTTADSAEAAIQRMATGPATRLTLVQRRRPSNATAAR